MSRLGIEPGLEASTLEKSHSNSLLIGTSTYAPATKANNFLRKNATTLSAGVISDLFIYNFTVNAL
jgi:hypothetical protein